MNQIHRTFFWKGIVLIHMGNTRYNGTFFVRLETNRVLGSGTFQISRYHYWKSGGRNCYQVPWVQVVLYNYYYHRRPLNLHEHIFSRLSALSFKLALRVKWGMSNSVKFWKDKRIGDVPLAETFPSL